MNRQVFMGIVAVILLIAVPFFFSLFYLNLLAEILVLAVFALSLNVLVGYTGLVSLGHAAFFGIGAYASALLAKEWSPQFLLTLLASVLIAAAASAVIGLFCVKADGFYFLMLTLAFSQMIYSFVHQSTTITGGSNGLSGLPSPMLGTIDLSNPVFLYYSIVLVFVVVYIVLGLIVKSPFGHVLIGIRENEMRMKAMGYNTALYKYIAFIIAGAIGGISGALYSNLNGFVSPNDVYWTMSGSVLIMVLIGGAGTMVGPVLGAAFIVILETIVSSYTTVWTMIIGIIFILFVVFMPQGLVGFARLFQKLAAHRLPISQKGTKPLVNNEANQ
ncbi:branched-chain amino acid ABC transporter permease [Geobacillus sp. 46C-IIa]|uniref:branched-chain amino acid ABC transporter permease n=1 Tax=Geobacillus sp. 46C-IIa TaxID=1963025 RepID=UPI0009BE6A81|nr:branched-chain amino acid ABC transporter permease [Geobacillus sp. 46C-IIa]OQP03871.1 branched-chain amino acid ABC transporter permease [Geobacillus sp. 46C-IIa]QNU26570.1 branched-chain amino acid ABC transporter permease [Geobacillus sp. 46C-IIa]